MTASLVSFQYISKGKWQSSKIDFADEYTIISGENGAGKTPLMRGIAYALGNPVQLPEEMIVNTDAAVLEIEKDGTTYKIEMATSAEFKAQVTYGKKTKSFSDIRTYSDFLFQVLQIPCPEITTKDKNAGRPYLAQIVPLFWVSQTKGWTDLYQPQRLQDFFSLQREEALRAIFNLQPKRPYNISKAFQEKRKEVQILATQIELKKEALKRFEVELGKLKSKSLEDIAGEKNSTKAMLEAAKQTLDSSKRVTSNIDYAIDENQREIYRCQDEIRDLKGKLEGLNSAAAEIRTEAEVLEANEMANDEFRSFCETSNCKLFETARKSYGKKLLYLKDQVKDIINTSSSLSLELSHRDERLKDLILKSNQLKATREDLLKEQGLKQIIKNIEDLGTKYSELHSQEQRVGFYRRQRENIAQLVIDKSTAEDAAKSLKPKGNSKDDGALLDALTYFKTSFRRWIDELNTPNTHSVDIRGDFTVLINDKEFSIDSTEDGSTRARIVLAHFAAILETSLECKGSHPGFLFLDTPKQQEIDEDDLRNFFAKFRQVLKKHKAQVVLACKDLIFEPTEGVDALYKPTFLLEGELRYLGPET